MYEYELIEEKPTWFLIEKEYGAELTTAWEVF